MASNVYECMFLLDTNKVAGDVKNADKTVRGIFERNGIEVRIIESHGARENLQRLADPGFRVDVGFVQGGLKDDIETEHLR